METDVLNCSRPESTRRVRSLVASGSVFGVLLLALLAGSASSLAENGVAPVAEPAAAAPASAAAPSASASSSREEQLSAKIAELDAILLERQKLEDSLRGEKGAQSAAQMQLENAKKLIRLELEDYLAQSNSSARLESLLQEYKRGAEEAQAIAARIVEVEKSLGSQHLKFSQAARDVERLKAQLAAEVRERNSRKVQEVARKLDKNLRFEEAISFRCSTSKSLAECLAEQRNDTQIAEWVHDQYQRALGSELNGEVSNLVVSPNWYRYRTKVDFSQASMTLDGTVNAQLRVEAMVSAKKIMPCAILELPYELCDSQVFSLIVRSNKYGDSVRINDQEHGSTPVSLVLDSGIYRIQVTAAGVTQKRTLSLNSDQVVNFRF